VTLLRVIVEFIVALCVIAGGGADIPATAAGGSGVGSASPGGGEKRRPVAESGGETPPGLRLALARRRSVEEMELEWARDLRLLTVTPRECCEFEFDAGADPDALRAECRPA
jgi:hypothetical protein